MGVGNGVVVGGGGDVGVGPAVTVEVGADCGVGNTWQADSASAINSQKAFVVMFMRTLYWMKIGVSMDIFE